ncbi:MAG TPA: aspartyl protease family protein [Candidatus Acidoferrales bacterium]|nr:aspartyl protease family protein [Candidatus Acidoferrales bacterium]
MPVSLEFAASHRYASTVDGIEVPVTLRASGQSIDLTAKVDTGAAHCIFERRYADLLGLTVESGRLQRFRTMSGSFSAYEHEITLESLGIEFSTFVFFAADSAFERNFLGRAGWLDHVRIAIIDYDGIFWLSAYDS